MSDSALYWGRVTHHRYLPREHKFKYRVMMFMLYLDELHDLERDVAGLFVEGNVTGPNAPVKLRYRLPGRYTLRRRDFLPDYRGSLDEAARAMYRSEVGTEAPGRIAVMANLSSLGWNFNPITLYFFYDGDTVDRAIAEVTNTPWGERHLYVLGAPGPIVFEKAHHVSPFLEMEGLYRLSYTEPAERFSLSMTLFDHCASTRDHIGARRFSATMSFSREPLTSKEVRRASRRYPDMAFRVSFRIYVQAARLFAKGIKYVPRPSTQEKGSDHVSRL